MLESRNPPTTPAPRIRVCCPLIVLLVFAAGWLGRLEGAGAGDGRKEWAAGNYEAAVRLASGTVASAPGDEEGHLLYVEALLALGRAEEAEAALREGLGRLPQSLRLQWLGREVAFANGKPEQATVYLGMVRSLYANRPSAYRSAPDLVVFGRAALLLGADPKIVLSKVYAPAQKAAPGLRDVYLARGELALEKHDFALAATAYEEGLKQRPADADLNYGLARAHEEGDRKTMLASLEQALEANPRHAPSLLLRADHAIDGERYAEAEEDLAKVLAVNSDQPDAWALRAVLAHLRYDAADERAARDRALRTWPNNPRVDWRIGEKLSRKYRFAEGSARQRQAIEFDPEYLPAKAQLASDLLRLGDEVEGWRLAQEVHQADGYDVEAFNLVTLKDTMTAYTTLRSADFEVRMTKHEAAVYGQEVMALLARAQTALVGKYGAELQKPTLVDIFADPKDFAVRTFGMPDVAGFLGVCFGRVVTANSPASTAAQGTNWQSVLWHEFCHVVTLQATRNRMPRWLSEGISVYEERQANPAWGQQMTPAYREMILGKGLIPVRSMSAAFLAPPTPERLQYAYYQASMVVEFLIERHGLDKLLAVLRTLREGNDINRALEQNIAPIAVIESGFAEYAKAQAKALGPELDWERPAVALGRSATPDLLTEWAAERSDNYYSLLQRARKALTEKKWAEAKVPLDRLLALYPGQRGDDSAWRLLARAQRELGETVGERVSLQRLARIDGEAPDAYQRLIELGTASADWQDVAVNAGRWLEINPLVAAPWRARAQATAALGEDAVAIAANRTLLRLDPANPAEVQFELARMLHRQGDPEARRHVLQALEEAPRHRAALRLLQELGPSAGP